MATVAAPSPASKPKAYHCTYLGLSGILVKPAAAVLFLEPESGAVITLSPEEVLVSVVINGEVGETMRQYVADQLAGGAAAICTSRKMRVA
jgi:hypothetical protein